MLLNNNIVEIAVQDMVSNLANKLEQSEEYIKERSSAIYEKYKEDIVKISNDSDLSVGVKVDKLLELNNFAWVLCKNDADIANKLGVLIKELKDTKYIKEYSLIDLFDAIKNDYIFVESCNDISDVFDCIDSISSRALLTNDLDDIFEGKTFSMDELFSKEEILRRVIEKHPEFIYYKNGILIYDVENNIE